jgi:hypothetical protein
MQLTLAKANMNREAWAIKYYWAVGAGEGPYCERFNLL